MTTLAELADKAQNALDDAGAGTWSQTVIEEWCLDAIRDYARFFPRTIQLEITTSADDNYYDLPYDFREIVSVEYPQGEDPPEFLQRYDYQIDDFWNSDDYYDVVERREATDKTELVISADPDADETIRVEYVGDHDLSVGSSDPITVPERHEDILVAYVVWAAWRELASAEMQSPTSNSSLLMAQLFNNAGSAEYDYRNMMRYAMAAALGKSRRTTWRMDKWDRTY
ncbi:MAG: hypothetical protein PVG14_09525 [Anaerolineales bacterium]|jgi:hypothetical protein